MKSGYVLYALKTLLGPPQTLSSEGVEPGVLRIEWPCGCAALSLGKASFDVEPCEAHRVLFEQR